MNIFVLDADPRVAAQSHLDKHVVKMIIEYAQLLSTAKRLLDGQVSTHHLGVSAIGKRYHLLRGETVANVDGKLTILNPVCYNTTHANHPCAIWARESDSNYNWLFRLFEACSHEYTHRYKKIHKTWSTIGEFLRTAPRNIAAGDLTPFPLAMGEEFRDDDPIKAYRNYYLGPKAAFARWTNRATPDWFKAGTKDFDVSHFERTTELA